MVPVHQLPLAAASGAGELVAGGTASRWIELNHLHLLCDVFEVAIIIELRPLVTSPLPSAFMR